MTWQQIIEEEARRLRDDSSIFRSLANMRYSNPANMGVPFTIKYDDKEFLNEEETNNFLRTVRFGYLSEATEKKLCEIIDAIPNTGIEVAKKDFIAVLDSEMPMWRDRLYLIRGLSYAWKGKTDPITATRNGGEIQGTTQYGECVVIKQEEMNGRQALVIESMRSDNAGLRELRREAKANKRMTIYLE